MALTESNSEVQFDSGSVLFFIYKWRYSLLIITISAIVLSWAFSSSLFITPKFRSNVILFPSASSSISKSLLTDRSTQRNDLLDFGHDAQIEHMLQILNSSRIRQNVVQRFNLLEHYGINPNDHLKQTMLLREYNRNVSFRRTEYLAVRISVLDKDAQMAADIANYIGGLVDTIRNQIQKEVAIPGLRIIEQQYILQSHQVKATEDSLRRLREIGVHDYETQTEVLTQQLAIEIARGNYQAIRALESKLALLAKYGGSYVSLKEQLEHDTRQQSLLKARYDEARVDAEQFLPFKFVVEPAIKAEKKSYPLQWLIVLISTFGTLVISILIILLSENFKEIALLVEKKKAR